MELLTISLVPILRRRSKMSELDGHTIKLKMSLKQVEDGCLRPGPQRVLVEVYPKVEESALLYVVRNQDRGSEHRNGRVISVGAKVKTVPKGIDILFVFRPSQKFWETYKTMDDKLLVTILPEMIITGI